MTVAEVWLLVAFKSNAKKAERAPITRNRLDELMKLDEKRQLHDHSG